MNVKDLKKKYTSRVVTANQLCEDTLNQVFREICHEYGWSEDAFVFTERDGQPWDYKYSISWTEGGNAVLKPIAKSLGKLLISLGFPSGS